MSGFQDARRRLVERDRRSRRRPVICGRRRVSPKRATTVSPPTAGKLSPPIGVCILTAFELRTEYPYGIFVPEPAKNIPRTRGGNAFDSPGPGGSQRSESHKSMSQVPFRTGASIEGARSSQLVRSRRDPASGPLARVRATRRPSFSSEATRRTRGVQRARLVLKTVSSLERKVERRGRCPRRTPRRSAWWTPSLGL